MQRVRLALGRSSQAQNIAASRNLVFSGSLPSRRKSRIFLLSLIFATFDTSVSSFVFFSVSYRFDRSSSSSSFSRGWFYAHQPLPTLSRTCITPCSDVAETCTAGARGTCWSVGKLELDAVGSPFTSRVSCPSFSFFQSLMDLCCSLVAVLTFLRGTPLSDFALVYLLALLCTWGTPGSGRVRRRRTVSGTLFDGPASADGLGRGASSI